MATIIKPKDLQKGFYDLHVEAKSDSEMIMGEKDDPAWKYKDKKGHWHKYNKKKITNGKLVHVEETDEDGEDCSWSYWRCSKCGERLWPGTKTELFNITHSGWITGGFMTSKAFDVSQELDLSSICKKLSGKILITEIETKTPAFGGRMRCSFQGDTIIIKK
jgi:hypothetical protein